MKNNWLWDKDITEEQVKVILADISDKRFISYAALLLSRNNSAKEIFSALLKKEDFFITWGRIKKQMRKNAWNDPRIEYWQAIYDTLKAEKPEFKKLKPPASAFSISDLSPFSIAKEIGSKIKSLREKIGLTQKDLAKKLGISQQIISRLEGGRQNVSIETLSIICAALGVPFTAEKLGFKLEEKQEMTENTCPFSSKSSEEFVKVVYEILERSKEFNNVQYYDGTGDKGRDIIVYKYSIGKKEQWYFQCKRYAKISFAEFKKELDKIGKHSQEDKSFKPDGIVFVTACKVSAKCKDDTKAYASEIGLGEVLFWTDVELTAKARAVGVYDELFPIAKKDLEEVVKKNSEKTTEDISSYIEKGFEKITENIKKHIIIASEPSKVQTLMEDNPSKNDEINKDIDIAVKAIHNNEIDEAKRILLEIKGKIEEKPGQYKEELVRIYNNLGVCYNRFKNDGGNFDEAEKFFHLALNLNRTFTKAQINLASLYLNRGREKDMQKAYNLAMSLWQDSDKKNSTIFEIYIQSIFHYQSPEQAVDFYENSKEAISLVEKDEKLSNLLATIYFNKQDFDKSEKLIDQALKIAPKAPLNLRLKASMLIQKAQSQDIITVPYEPILRFKKSDNIEKALDLLCKAEDELKKINNKEAAKFLINQIRYDMSFCMLCLRRFEEYKETQKTIDSMSLNDDQKDQIKTNNMLLEIERRNFETAYSMLIDFADWVKWSYEEKRRFAHIFLWNGAPQQSKDIYLGIEEEAERKKDISFYLDMSSNEVLLHNKPLVIEYVKRAKDFAANTSEEKYVCRRYNAIMMRYAHDNEDDRLMTGVFEDHKKFPESKVLIPIKAYEEDGTISEALKSFLNKQKVWYEKIKQNFRESSIPTYFLKEILNRRTYAEILSFRSWDELDFTFELTLPDISFKDHLLSNLEKSESLVFDYASLLNLSKMNLLGYLEKLGKGIFVSKKLFQKIQEELLQIEQEDLRNLWRFLKDSKIVHIVESIIKQDDGKYDLLLKGHDWIIDSLLLSKEKKAAFVIDDLVLLRFFYSEEGIKGANSLIILKSLLNRGWIDGKIYATSIGDLAERFYTFLPFSGEDLFQIVIEDRSKISLRAKHLVNEISLSGSVATSFTAVFVRFVELLWNTGSLPKDKVDWLSFLTEKIVKLGEEQGGLNNIKELEQVASDLMQMWVIAIQKSGKDEILLLETRVNKISENPAYNLFKDNISRFIQVKKGSL